MSRRREGNMEVDEALEELGGFTGRWQLICFCFLSSSMMIPACLFLLNVVFLGLTPPHHCTVPENVSLPVERDEDGRLITSQCSMFNPNTTDNSTLPCQDGWTYDTSDIGWTIVSEFDLVCGQEFYISLIQTLLVAGMTIGSVIVAPLPDQFGRKPVHLVTIFLLSMVTLATSFSYHYVSFVVLRTITGILIIGSLSALIACVELFPASGRAKAGILVQVPWTFAMFLLLILAYFLRNWRHLQLISSLIPLIFIFGYWVYPESVPWLVAQGRYAEAEGILQRAAVGSRVRMPKKILHIPDHLPETGKKSFSERVFNKENGANLLLLFKSSMMRKHAGIMLCVWFCNALVYYGISFLSTTWAGNRFINFFLNALVEIPAIAMCLLTLEKFGRRLPIASFHIIAGLCLLISVIVPSKSGSVDLNPLIVTCNVLAKTFITASFDGVWLYSPELFPTNLRSTGIGVVQFGARAGAMIAPFSMALAARIPWLPGLVFTSIAIICGLLILFLPETFDKPLAQSLSDMDQWPVDACLDVLKGCCKRLDRYPPEALNIQSDVTSHVNPTADVTNVSELRQNLPAQESTL